MAKNRAVFGIYPNRGILEDGIAQLHAGAFRNTDISTLSEDNLGTKELAHRKGTKAPEGVAAGAIAGGILGGILGWMAATGMLAGPGLETLLAAGTAVAMLAGVGAGGVLGGIVGALAGAAMPEYEAKRYRGRLRKGGILLSVHCDNDHWAKKAREILRHSGAEQIATAAECKADYAVSDKPTARRAAETPRGVLPTPRGAAAQKPAVHSTHGESVTTEARPEAFPQQPGAAEPWDRYRPASAKHLHVKEVMTTKVEMVNADAPLSEAADTMRKLGVGFLPVRSGEAVVGLLTDRDIMIRASAEGFDPVTTTVRSAMTTHYAYCLDDQDVAEAARIMEAQHVRRLPVVDKDMRLVGVISVTDLATKAGDEKLAGEILRVVAAQTD